MAALRCRLSFERSFLFVAERRIVTPEASAAAPRSVANYDRLEPIGTSTSVFRARQRGADLTVAIKVLPPEVASQQALFNQHEKQFRLASGLEHPNIVRCLDFGRDRGTAYLVMELVEGKSLADLIAQEGRLAEGDAIRIITQIGQALHMAHRRGVVHGDIKPGSILVSSDGRAKLNGFALLKDYAKTLASQAPESSVDFVAPEQYIDARNISVRCDVYSLAATLYMAVTGQPPVGDRLTQSVLLRHMDKDVPPPSGIVSGLSAQVDQAIARALQADPGARQMTALRFIQDLTQKASGSAEAIGKASHGKERRVSVRYPYSMGTVCNVDLSTTAAITEDFFWPAIVRDLSEHGIGLLLARRFEQGTVLSVELQKKKEASPRLIKVTRVSPEKLGHWVLGCEFVEHLAQDELAELL
jgi:serine/threonine protein kinase